MAGITGQGTTYNLPNFVGELFLATPTDTPFLSMIGGINGAKEVNATKFQWQGRDLRSAAQNVALEGAPAPTGQERVRFNVYNVVEVHQEVVEVSYTKQAATGLHGGLNIDGTNPVADELGLQIADTLSEMARDVEWAFLNGTFQEPADNTTARQTRGILAAITTNVIAKGGAPAVATTDINTLAKTVYDNGGLRDGMATLVVPSIQKINISKAFTATNQYREASRTVAGVAVSTIVTDFGVLNVVLDRYMPNDTIALVQLDECRPVVLPTPGKGSFFAEPLAKTGASERVQLYGEIGLEYGNEKTHGKITGLAVV